MPQRPDVPTQLDDWRAHRPLLGSTAVISAFAAAALALFFSLTAGAAPAQRGAQDPAAIYHDYCSVCHGDRGDGRSRSAASLSTPPRDFTAPGLAQHLTVDRMAEAIRNGRPGTAMVGWKRQLTEEQIQSVARYVRDAFVAPSASPLVQRGRGLYLKNCASCHGEQGRGAPAAGGVQARDFRTPQAASELTRERMVAAITFGKPGTAMAGFERRLSREDIGAVVEYIRTSIMTPVTPGISGSSAHGRPQAGATRHDMNQPLPRRLVGDPDKGRSFYRANCATCHGETGDGNGPRAYFIRPRPRVLIDAAARAQFNRPALYTAIAEGRPGTEMPAWDKVLTPQEIANVAEYVFRSFIQPREQARAREGK